jgi:hypothetical protein
MIRDQRAVRQKLMTAWSTLDPAPWNPNSASQRDVITPYCSRRFGDAQGYVGNCVRVRDTQPRRGNWPPRRAHLLRARGRITGVSERIAPTGSTVAAVVLGDPIRLTPGGGGAAFTAETGFLIGPYDPPVVNETQGETYCVGIVTRPVGCRPSFALGPAALHGRVLDLMEASPRATALRIALLSCRSPAEALDVVESTLRTTEPFGRAAFARCEAAVEALFGESSPSCRLHRSSARRQPRTSRQTVHRAGRAEPADPRSDPAHATTARAHRCQRDSGVRRPGCRAGLVRPSA